MCPGPGMNLILKLDFLVVHKSGEVVYLSLFINFFQDFLVLTKKWILVVTPMLYLGKIAWLV